MALQRHSLAEALDATITSSRSSRAPSFSSDRRSVASSTTFHMPTTVRPAPAYIAASVASQLVTDAHNAQLHDADYEADADADADSDPDAAARNELTSAVFAEPALALLNAFLDHLLFAFLSTARTPSLAAIRPAIADVLKPRLAREATEAADEELDGLLAGDDDDEMPVTDGVGGSRAAEQWDVDKVWKRTRLRIMVYTRLGELEDDDEERYVQQERGLSMDDDDADDAGLVSWAAAIFLTSVIEYVAEQTLLASGAAADARVAARRKKRSHHADAVLADLTTERLVIEEPDVEKIALNAALGRLWRTWRKRVRSPVLPLSPGRAVRPISSSSSLYRPRACRESSEYMIPECDAIPERTPTETEIASNIPLPQGDNDVNEIEVPGLANAFDDEHLGVADTQPSIAAPRPRPLSIMAAQSVPLYEKRANKRPTSLPIRSAPLFMIPPPTPPISCTLSPHSIHSTPSSPSENGDVPFETPMERMQEADSYIGQSDDDENDTEQQREATRRQLESGAAPVAAMVAAATVTAAVGRSSRPSSVTPIQTQKIVQGGHLDRDGAETDASTPGGYESEPKVLESQRMSIEKSGPPGVVRSFSSKRNSSRNSSQQTPLATPIPTQLEEGESCPTDEPTDSVTQKTIGMAQTSDVPILSTSTPALDSSQKAREHGGYVAMASRKAVPTSILPYSSPASDVRPVQTAVSTDSVVDGSAQPDNTISAPHKQEAASSSPRSATMPRLQPMENGKVIRTTEVVAPLRSPTLRSSPTMNHSKRSPPRSSESLVTGTGQRTSTSDSLRSQIISHDQSLSDKASLKRVISSSSSAKRSNGAAAMSSGRESTASHRSRNLSGRMSEEDREREFDSLVKGKDTVKFTLTPENMRALDDTSGASKTEPPKPSSLSSNVTVYPRVNAEDSQFGTANLPRRTFSRSRGAGPTATHHKPSPSRTVVSKPMAREARIETESMRDFADFIRSTGPSPGQEKPIQPLIGKNGNAPSSINGSTSSLRRHGSTSQTSLRRDGASTRTRMNMEPRSPAGLSNGNDDLIDFIRQGPPNANDGQPRIPRHVAPFRTTVDSDQFETMLGGHSNVESAFGSTTSTVDSKHSTTTINSRTGLIPTPGVVQPAYSNTPQQLSGNMTSNEPTITPTRRRVRDPYAVDFSDEDDDDEDDDQLTALPHSSQPAQPARQESLMDFLNGAEPPSDSKPQPFVLSEGTIAAARSRAASSTPTISSATPARNSTGFGSGPTSSVSSNAPGAYKPRLQARAPAVGDIRTSASTSRTATSELADFLRDSGPPEMPPVVLAKKEEEKKSRRFWKRGKKSAD